MILICFSPLLPRIIGSYVSNLSYFLEMLTVETMGQMSAKYVMRILWTVFFMHVDTCACAMRFVDQKKIHKTITLQLLLTLQ